MLDWLSGSQIAANFATTAGVVGLGIAYWQLRSTRAIQREATAIGIWKDYLELALQHPKLSLPEPYMVLRNRGTEQYKQYEWFVSSLLFACEQVLSLEPDSDEWKRTVASQLSYHQHYLHTTDFEPGHYGPPLQAIIADTLASLPPHSDIPAGILRRPA